MFVEHPLIRKGAAERREYQLSIAKECLEESTLVVLPTGLGKTVIALLVIAETIKKGDGRVLFMAPTKPLVDQHAAFLAENLLIDSITTFTGEVPPERRRAVWEDSRVIVSTPQVIANDLLSGGCSLRDFSLLVFDEAHRAVGDYAYVYIGERYCQDREGPLVLGMTASPGYDIQKIAEVCKNLGMTNIATRSELDEDVVPYVYGIAVERVRVDVPEETDDIADMLESILDENIKALRKYKLLDEKRDPTTRDLLEVGNVLKARLNSGKKNFHLFRAMTIQAAAMKISHAIDLARTQGTNSVRNYLARIVDEAGTKEGSRASKDLVKDARFEMARRLLDSADIEHPKLEKVSEIVSEQLSSSPDSRVIVFTHYRDTCDMVTDALQRVPLVRPARFVGQATTGEDHGLRQREQKEIIDRFKRGEHNVLVATSVAEEGLDIPSTDLVVFYEPVPSEIRTIQRRGRTGRHRPGRVVVLLARNTKDEAFLYSSRRKEQKMRAQLESLKRRLGIAKRVRTEQGGELDVERLFGESTAEGPAERRAQAISKEQTLLSDFDLVSRSGLRLTANQDRNRDVLRELKKVGINFDLSDAQQEDFLIGEDVAVIRESIDAFLAEIDSDRLTSRIARIRQRGRRPILVVEGGSVRTDELARRLPVYDILNLLIGSFGIPVLPTSDAPDTAAYLASLVKCQLSKDLPREGARTPQEATEYQRRMLEGLPNVTSVLADRLLERFGNLQNVLSASPEELMTVDGVGRVIAEGIRSMADEQYGQGPSVTE